MQFSPRLRSTLYAAAGAVLWGTWPLFLKAGGLTSVQLAFVVFAIVALPAPFLLRRQALSDHRATAALVVVGLADAGNLLLYLPALERGPIAVAVTTHYLGPLIVALSAPWIMAERRSVRAIVAAPITLLALVSLVGFHGSDSTMRTAALGAASAFFFALVVMGSKRASSAYSPMAITSLHAVISGAVLLSLNGRLALPPSMSAGVLSVALGGLVCSLAGSVLFNVGLRHIRVATAGTLTYLEPVTATLIGAIFLGQALGKLALVDVIAILAVGVWASREP